MKPTLPANYTCLGCYHCEVLKHPEPICTLRKIQCAGKCLRFEPNNGRRP